MIILLILIGWSNQFPLMRMQPDILGTQFKGTWVTLSNKKVHQIHAYQKQFNYLDGQAGQAFLRFKSDGQAHIGLIQIQILDPKWRENKFIQLQSKLGDYDENSSSWSGISNINYTRNNEFTTIYTSTNVCSMIYVIKLQTDQSLQITMTSHYCQIEIEMDMKRDYFDYQLQVVMYNFALCIICFGQFLCVTILYANLQDPLESRKYSILTIAYLTIKDGILCINNISYGLEKEEYFYHFLVPALLYLFMCMTSDRKLLWSVWKGQHMELNHQEQLQTSTIFYLQFYCCMIIIFIVNLHFSLKFWFSMLNGLLMIPQIITNMVQGHSPRYFKLYVCGVLTSTVLVPLYFRGCPENFRGLEPSMLFLVVWGGIYFFQMFVLFMQYIFGSRIFFPRWLAPRQYDYYRPLKDESVYNELCVVCLETLRKDDAEGLDQPFLPSKFMVTPCNHVFHDVCLQNWLCIKHQCPTCRSVVPQITQ